MFMHAPLSLSIRPWLTVFVMVFLAQTLLYSQASSAELAEKRFQDIEALRVTVQQRLEAFYAERYPELALGDSLKINVGNLDRRLQLPTCPTAIKTEIKTLPNNANATVKTSCRGDVRWTIYVPASATIYRDVVVASRSLLRGTELQDGDLTTMRMDIANLNGGYVEDYQRLLGMELTRPVRAQTPVKMNFVRLPDIISKGQSVVLRVKLASLTVETEGTALSNGHMGEKIKVRNDQSRRIVDGMVTGPGEVLVAKR